MTFTKTETLILIVGICGLLLLGWLNYGKWANTPTTSPLPQKAAVPDEFKQDRPLRWNGLVFTVNRQRKTVCATDEKTGAQVWESDGEDQFIVPGAAFPIDLSPEGNLWVANVGKKHLEQLDPQTGRFIAAWQPKESFGGCCNPVRFAVLAGGRFLTMEKGTGRACIYKPSGELERIVNDKMSRKEDNYYLVHTDKAVLLYDAGTSSRMEVPYE